MTQVEIDGNSIVALVADYDSSTTTALAYSTSLMANGTAYKEVENIMVFAAPTIELLNESF